MEITFTDKKPIEPGFYLVKYKERVNGEGIMLVEISEDVIDCDCDAMGCSKCNKTGLLRVLTVDHPSYYNFCESEQLEIFHSAGPNATSDKRKSKYLKPDLWSNKLNI